MDVQNIVACCLGENGIDSLCMTFCSLDVNWEKCMKLEHDILVLSFENVDMIYEDYCMENVIRNLK